MSIGATAYATLLGSNVTVSDIGTVDVVCNSTDELACSIVQLTATSVHTMDALCYGTYACDLSAWKVMANRFNKLPAVTPFLMS